MTKGISLSSLVSMLPHWFSLAPIDSHLFSLAPIGSHWLPLTPIGSHWLPLTLMHRQRHSVLMFPYKLVSKLLGWPDLLLSTLWFVAEQFLLESHIGRSSVISLYCHSLDCSDSSHCSKTYLVTPLALPLHKCHLKVNKHQNKMPQLAPLVFCLKVVPLIIFLLDNYHYVSNSFGGQNPWC